MSTKKVSDLIVLDEMSSRNMDIAAATDITNYQRTEKRGGGLVTVGVASPMFDKLINSAGTGDGKYVAILYCVNYEEFQKLKKEMQS